VGQHIQNSLFYTVGDLFCIPGLGKTDEQCFHSARSSLAAAWMKRPQNLGFTVVSIANFPNLFYIGPAMVLQIYKRCLYADVP